jgi:hypothetical protein
MRKLRITVCFIFCVLCIHAQNVVSVVASSQRIVGEKLSVVQFRGVIRDTVCSFQISDSTVNITLPQSGFYRFCFSNTFSFPLFLSGKSISMVISAANFPESINDSENQTMLKMLKRELFIMKNYYYYKKEAKDKDLLMCRSMIETEIKAIDNTKISTYLLSEYYSNMFFSSFDNLDVVKHKSELSTFLEDNYTVLADTDAPYLFSVRFCMLNLCLTNSKKEWANLNDKDFKIWSQKGMVNGNDIHCIKRILEAM